MSRPESRRGTSESGMEYAAWGVGPRTLLFLPGGPLSTVPKGWTGRTRARLFAPYVAAGYQVWLVTRRRHMPAGHSIGDIAADHAQFVDEYLGGRVDVVVGESLGGLIAQHLAADHPGKIGLLVLVGSAYRVNDWGRGVDGRIVAAMARGDRRAAASAYSEYVVRSDRMRPLREWVLGPVLARLMLSGKDYPASDLAVEADAERSFDGRALLPRIGVPVLMFAGDRDRFFATDVAEETARLIPDSRVIWMPGKDHFAVCASGKVAPAVLKFAEQAGRH